jgi:hypothetical protein
MSWKECSTLPQLALREERQKEPDGNQSQEKLHRFDCKLNIQRIERYFFPTPHFFKILQTLGVFLV